VTEIRLSAGGPRWERWAAGTGVAFAVLALVAFLFAVDLPGPDDNAQDVAQYFADNDTAIKWQAFFFGVAAAFFLWFAGTLASLLRRAEGEPAGRLPAIVLVGAATSASLYLLGIADWLALAKLSEDGLSDAPALYDAGNGALSMSNFSAAAFVGAASLAVLRTRLIASWIALAGVAFAVLLLVDGLVQMLTDSDATSAFGTVVFLLFLVWTALLSAMLALTVARPVEPARA
jgi:hypothetical protein